jgi:hypothetical protein
MPTPSLDPQLLDDLARIYMRVALDAVLREMEESGRQDQEEAVAESDLVHHV